MDPTVKQMIDGFKMGVDAQAGMAAAQDAVEEVRGIIAKMEEIANEPGMDIMKFQERMGAEGLMDKYGEAMARLATAGEAAVVEMADAVDEAAAEAEPVDLAELDIYDLEVAVGPHRQVYETTVKKKTDLPYLKAAYEALFALADECETVVEFNRRAMADGHLSHLGLAGTWDANMNTFEKEVVHKQPDMITYALDALETTRDNPFPETIVYALNRLAFLNERKMAVRQSKFSLFNAFAAELSAYLILVHTEEQRQKAVNMFGIQKELTGWGFDEAAYDPYVRQLLTMGDAGKRAELGPDYLGIFPFLRVGWYLDASLSPDEKKELAEAEEPPRPPAYPYPYRTGPVGGVELTVEEPQFTAAFDEPYPVKLSLANNSGEARKLDAKKGLRIWVIAGDGAETKKFKADLPAELGPGETWSADGDLYAWGLPKEERLYLVAFDVGLEGEYGCDLAEKYGDPNAAPLDFKANCFLEPFEGGCATDPVFAAPRRPVPEYPFPIPVE
ncbi:MAG: hypothetical protein JSW52_11305 [Candidatus Coatesbacteria bacterium]|nr:MAG: hypothetical protein JSW52_11305 [Candidatus Coatesbacteria bacterium]